METSFNEMRENGNKDELQIYVRGQEEIWILCLILFGLWAIWHKEHCVDDVGGRYY